MNARPLVCVLVAAVVASLATAGCGSKPAEPVVKKVDHITISTDNAAELFATLNGTLGLPAAWPFMDYPGFQTGGIQAGNVNLETLNPGAPPASGGQGSASVYGIVFEPYPLDQITGALKARGAEPSQPQVQQREINGKQVPFWTNVTLQALCRPDYIVYLCEYTEAAKSGMQSRQASGPLGGLGLLSVSEIHITSKDAAALKKKWAQVFAPSSMSSGGLMPIGAGPAVRTSTGKRDAIEGLVLEVASLSKAKEFLQAKGLLGSAAAGELRIEPSKVQGLDIRVVEKKGK